MVPNLGTTRRVPLPVPDDDTSKSATLLRSRVPTVLDLFAGCGGFSLGLKWARLDVKRAVENFRPVAASYAENFPGVDLTVEDIQKVVVRDPFDVVVGGPPCEPYTSASTKREADPLDRLYKNKIGGLVLHFVRIVADVKPKAFVMENVMQVAEGPLRQALIDEFAKAGYPTIHFNELFAENQGTPSHRRRLFISNLALKPPKYEGKKLTVEKALANLPPPGQGTLPNHLAHPLTADKLARIRNLPQGRSLYSYRSGTGKLHGNWWRLRPDELAPTVTGHARFVHPTEDRLLTVREHARLMGFPDDFLLRGGRNIQYDVIGEAVPPPLAKAIGLEVLRQLPA
ncbi:MAG TPA: DNA cytosine methyltransferase [Candidatus Thermoplasmatota archaeon]|nr:DNA cytosine methyltransferase [Candidatus Thermoplasmatota archaeon]